MAGIQWGGRTWGPADLKAFQAFLGKRGVTYSKWAGNHPGSAASTFGLTGSPDDALASGRAEAALAPLRADIESQRKQSAGLGTNLLKNNAGFYEALGEMLKSIGPATKDAYSDAAGSVAGFAKGFSSDMGATQDADKAALQAFLEKTHAPQAAIDQAKEQVGGTDAQDVAFGLGGYIPASSLTREGAAFTAAADKLPAYAAGMGLENARQINADVSQKDAGYADQLKQLSEKYPELRQQELQAILEARRAQEALDIQRAYLGLSARKTGAEVTGVDPVTGLPTPEAQAAAKAAATKKGTATNAAAAKREDAFSSARISLFEDAKDFVKTNKANDDDPWGNNHPTTTRTGYVEAKKALFNKYKSLLRFSSRKYQYKLKKRLNAMIDEALAAQGIVPPTPKSKAKPKYIPGVTDYPTS